MTDFIIEILNIFCGGILETFNRFYDDSGWTTLKRNGKSDHNTGVSYWPLPK